MESEAGFFSWLMWEVSELNWISLPSLKLRAKAPENRPSQMEIYLPSIFRGEVLVSGRVVPV